MSRLRRRWWLHFRYRIAGDVAREFSVGPFFTRWGAEIASHPRLGSPAVAAILIRPDLRWHQAVTERCEP
jgi:hypothetical protein